jgi:hypothetical protein
MLTLLRHCYRPKLAALMTIVMGIGSGCASVEPVAAWERGYLADPAMMWASNPRERKLQGHVYNSKEASAGGAGAAGGGCGCN